MRDAIGGVINIQFILIFIVLVSSYLAFSVNYTKAFRAKNKIIDVYEAYEGNLKNEGAQKAIHEYLSKISYRPDPQYVNAAAADCNNCDCSSGLYCIRPINADSSTTGRSKEYAEITTFVSIDFPIINQIMPHIDFFRIKGSTKTILTQD